MKKSVYKRAKHWLRDDNKDIKTDRGYDKMMALLRRREGI